MLVETPLFYGVFRGGYQQKATFINKKALFFTETLD